MKNSRPFVSLLNEDRTEGERMRGRGGGAPTKVGRWRWLVCFALLLGLASAAPLAIAADPKGGSEGNGPDSSIESIPGPSPAELAAVESKEEEEEEWRESPQAVAERAESREAYSDVSASEAADLLVDSFQEALAALEEDPGRVLTGLEIEMRLGTNAAVVGDGEGGEVSLLETSVPVASELGGEGLKPVDLTLERSEGGFVPANPVSKLELPATADGAIRLHRGIEIQIPTATEHVSEALGEHDLFIPETEPSTDTLLSPIAGGVAISEQIRSIESPDEFTFEMNLPAGATLQKAADGGAEVVAENGTVIEKIPPSTAVDAQGAPVPVVTRISGNDLVVEVATGTKRVSRIRSSSTRISLRSRSTSGPGSKAPVGGSVCGDLARR